VRLYRANHFADQRRFWITVVFLLVSIWFTLVSFRRAKKTLRLK
jgi:cbb3-type cytochrome oxidase subunit 3